MNSGERPGSGAAPDGGAEVAVMLYTVDDSTGSAYIRQWLMPEGAAEEFAATMTARFGKPAEVMADATAAAARADEVMLVLGDTAAEDT